MLYLLYRGEENLKRWEWGVGNGDRDRGRDWDWDRESGAVGRQPIEDNRCGNQLSAIRLPLSEFAYYFFK